MDSLHKKDTSLDALMPMIRQHLAEGKSVRFTPMGTSMLPMLRHGVDTVTLSPLPERLKKYDLPLYQRDNGQYVLHRVIRVGQNYTCMGDHQIDAEFGLRHGQMIGLVTEFVRGGKTVSVTDWRYRLYCRLWPGVQLLRKCCRRLKRMTGRLLK